MSVPIHALAVATTPTAAAVAPKTASSDRMSSMPGAARAGSARRCRRPDRTGGDGRNAAATLSSAHAQKDGRMGRRGASMGAGGVVERARNLNEPGA